MTITPSVYEIRVQGHLDQYWSDGLGDVALAHGGDGTSTLTVAADQAQLHGVLAGLRDIGATLISLHTDRSSSTASSCISTQSARSPLTKPIRTERLTLRSAIGEDAKTTFVYRQLPSVGEWLVEVPSDYDTYAATFTEAPRLAATVIVEHSGVTIGDFMLRVEDAWAQREVADQAQGCQAELGWVLDPSHTGHGYATEAVRELVRYCFEDLGVHRIVANCFADNSTSWRLMERVGMRREAHAVRDSLHRSGQWLDGYTYALLADEWLG